MELTYFDASGSAAAAFGPVIGAIGTPKFDASLQALTYDTARCAHLTAFSFSSARSQTSAPKILMAVDRGNTPIAQRLASKYIRQYWQLDPANKILNSEPAVGRGAALRLQPHEIENSDYRRDCYRAVDLIDRFSIIKTLGNEVIRLNFYRKASGGRFSESDLTRLSALAELALPAIRRHHALCTAHTKEAQYELYCRQLATSAPQLSRREIQVCAEIVLGLSSVAIASKLGISINTVFSHRKQAYAKLDISSQRELFQMLMQRRS